MFCRNPCSDSAWISAERNWSWLKRNGQRSRHRSNIKAMLRYHVAYYLPSGDNRMVVAEALDFPGVCSQGFDLADARLMIASALEKMAQLLLEEGKPLPIPNVDAAAEHADLIEILPLTVEAGATRL